MKLLRLVCRTEEKFILLIARVMLGVVFFPHGAQKVLGWFGGAGFSNTLHFFTGTLHFPAALVLLDMAAEFLGAIALIFGFFGRVAALGIGVVMVVAITTTHYANGFFMNWSGAQHGEGFEYHLLALALAAIVFIAGSGPASFDSRFSRPAEQK